MKDAPTLSSAQRPTETAEVREMFDTIAPTYDLLNAILSCGLHTVWERKLVTRIPAASTDTCLDICTGTGALVKRLAPRYREVVGLDISPRMLDEARRRHNELLNVTWLEGDAQRLPFEDQSFDAVTVSYGVRNLPDVRAGLREIHRVLRTGGTIGILEFGTPSNSLWRSIFSMYSRYVIPLIGGAISGKRGAYEYLPTTAAAFPCGEAFESLLVECGLHPQETVPLMGGVAFLYIAERRGVGFG